MYILNSEAYFIALFIVQILSLLKITNDLIDICYESYDARNGTNDTLTEESVDFRQASSQLVELRNNLDSLFEAATTNSAYPLGIGNSIDVVIELLSRCEDDVNKMETMLKQKSGRKRVKGPSSSFNQEAILNGLASSTNALRTVVERTFRCVCALAMISNADNVYKGPLLEPVLEIRRLTSTVSIE